MKLYLNSLALHLKSELEYRMSFIISFLSQILIFFTYYFVIIALFSKFNNIKGFTLYEVLLCFSIIHFGFAFNETFFRGVDKFDKFIIGGSLGLTEKVLKLANQKICFSKMTFPHQLIRIFLLEQLFRAFKISNGETYHR